MEKHEHSIIAVPPENGTRRRSSGLFKRELVEQTLRAKVSIASVAPANGVNTNLLARWRCDYLAAQAAGQSPTLTPIQVMHSQAAPSSAPTRLTAMANDGEIEVRRGDAAVSIRGAPNQIVLGMVLRELRQPGPEAPR